MMRAQRVREGESRVEMQIAKWTAEGAVKGSGRVFCDVGHTSVAGNMQVFRKVHGSFRETRWHRGWYKRIDTLVLDRRNKSVRTGALFFTGSTYLFRNQGGMLCIHH